MLRPSDVMKPNADEQAKARELKSTIDVELRRYDRKPVEVRLITTFRVAQLIATNYRENDWLVDVKHAPGTLSEDTYALTFTIPSSPRSGPGQV